MIILMDIFLMTLDRKQLTKIKEKINMTCKFLHLLINFIEFFSFALQKGDPFEEITGKSSSIYNKLYLLSFKLAE